MDKKRFDKRFTINKRISDEPVTQSEYQQSERILAKMVARAYAQDHPTLFGPRVVEVLTSAEHRG